jgi:hypothetical protein
MTIYRFGRPILSFLFKRKRIQERAQKIFEKLVGENQAAGLSRDSAYNAAKQELKKKFKLKTDLKGNVLNRSEGGEVPKFLAGGLLGQGIRLIYKDPASKAALKKLATWVKKKYKVDPSGKLGALGKLELKHRKAEGFVKYSKLLQKRIAQNPERFKSLKKAEKAKNVFKKTELQAEAYKKKVNLITKTLMHRKPNVTFHSEGGEVVFGKNVDKDLL